MGSFSRRLGVSPDTIQRRDFNIHRGPFPAPAPPVVGDAYLTILPDPPFTPPTTYPGVLSGANKVWTVTPGVLSIGDYVYAWITPPAVFAPTGVPRTGKRYFETRFQSTLLSGNPTEYYLSIGLLSRAIFFGMGFYPYPVPTLTVTETFGASNVSSMMSNFPWLPFSGGAGNGSRNFGATAAQCEYAAADFNRYPGNMDLIIGVAIDYDAGRLWVRNNSSAWLTGDPTTGASPLMTEPTPGMYAQSDPLIGTWRNGGPAGGDRLQRTISLLSNSAQMSFGIPTGFTVQNLGL